MKIIKKDEPIGIDIDQDGNISVRELVYEIYPNEPDNDFWSTQTSFEE